MCPVFDPFPDYRYGNSRNITFNPINRVTIFHMDFIIFDISSMLPPYFDFIF